MRTCLPASGLENMICQSDYQQIVAWAQETGKSPEELISLLEEREDKAAKGIAFIVEDGSIKQVAFPESIIFQEQILTMFWFTKTCKAYMRRKPACRDRAVEPSDASRAVFSGNQLTELKLSNLRCWRCCTCRRNQIAKLDLSNVPMLAELYCSSNQLTELDFSNLQMLTGLFCEKNQLTELDLSNVPALTSLSCSDNQITKLDLSNLLALDWLDCEDNQLTELDLSNVPALTSLDCSDNQITETRPLQRPSAGNATVAKRTSSPSSFFQCSGADRAVLRVEPAYRA